MEEEKPRKPHPTTNQVPFLENIHRISGAASVHLYSYHNRYIILLGDVHKSYKNGCTSCSPDNHCFSIINLIRELQQYSLDSLTNLDVYLEFPYVALNHTRDREKMKVFMNEFMKRESGLAARVKNWIADTIGLDILATRVGYMRDVYETFKDAFYHAPHSLYRKEDSLQRFHLGDARFEKNADKLLMIQKKDMRVFRSLHKSRSNLKRALSALFFSADYARDIEAIYGPSVAKGLVVSSYLSGGRTKISKQLKKAGDPRLRSFLRKRLNEALDEHDPFWISFFNEDDEATEEFIPDELIPLYFIPKLIELSVIVMDAYVLGRLLSFLKHKQRPQSVSLIYAGDAHIETYRQYLSEVLHLKPIICKKRSIGEINLFNYTTVKRCFEMTKCASSPPASGKKIKGQKKKASEKESREK